MNKPVYSAGAPSSRLVTRGGTMRLGGSHAAVTPAGTHGAGVEPLKRVPGRHPEWRETTMLRLLHLADVHLGARHVELGSAGTEQRERQWQAFEAALALATSDHCDLVVIAGDLFDSNAQPRRTIERAAKAMGAAVAAGARVVILPGDSDPYDAASIYRTYDLTALAGLPPDTDGLHVLVPGRMTLVVPALDLAVRGYVAAPPASLDEALGAPRDEAETGVRLRIGVAHGRVGPAGTTGMSDQGVAASGLDYLALGGAMEPVDGAAGTTRWADPGPPELLDAGASSPGQALFVMLDPDRPERARIEPRPVGRSRRLRVDLPAAGFEDELALIAHLASLADADLACDVHVSGTRPAGLLLDEASLEGRLAPGFLHLRIHDQTLAAGPSAAAPPESIGGAFARDLGDRIAAAATAGHAEEERELREQLDLGARLLAGSTGMPV